MPEFYMVNARKISKIPEFSEFHTIFARKVSEFYITIARKISFPIFFFGGGARAGAPCPPVSYA